MNEKVYVIRSKSMSPVLEGMLRAAVGQWERSLELLAGKMWSDLHGQKILFAIELDCFGQCPEVYEFLKSMIIHDRQPFRGSVGAILVHGPGELYTKTFAQKLVFDCNQLGMRLIGRPLAEATGSLRNLVTTQKKMALSGTPLTLEEVSQVEAENLGYRLKKFQLHRESEHAEEEKPSSPKIVAIHAGNAASNTLMLWHMVKKNLNQAEVKEIGIENGAIKDCIGCSYRVCKHYGQQTSCFYGGVMVEEVYPAILEADTVVFVCPNYNDAVSANLSAAINRLTALFRKTKFYNKNVFAVIVSGHSGCDALARQLISALNMNKTFQLPPRFALMEIANDSGEIYQVEGIQEKAAAFARQLEEAPWQVE